jgi:hypothetical protein
VIPAHRDCRFRPIATVLLSSKNRGLFEERRPIMGFAALLTSRA